MEDKIVLVRCFSPPFLLYLSLNLFLSVDVDSPEKKKLQFVLLAEPFPESFSTLNAP